MSVVNYIRKNNITTGIQRRCPECGNLHDVFYKVFRDGTEHVAGICEDKLVYFLKEEGLDIPYINDIKDKMRSEAPETQSMDI